MHCTVPKQAALLHLTLLSQQSQSSSASLPPPPPTQTLATSSIHDPKNKKRLEDAIQEVSTCAISGAVGTFANINPKVEKHVAKKLGLKVEPISTQVIPRDRHAFYFSVPVSVPCTREKFYT